MRHRTKTKSSASEAMRHLSEVDSILGAVIEAVGPCDLGSRRRSLFDSLAGSIISQQLSDKASTAIERRIETTCGLSRPFFPEQVMNVPVSRFREAGLSSAKATYIRGIAGRILEGQLQLESLASEADEIVIEQLVELPGVGVWTAEMFLIFGLGRLDVLSTGDAGLCRAVRQLYRLRTGPSERQFIKLAERWRPYRSVASWYLWRTLD
jgi:DNA-3-methyladenine glycosylase II